MNSLLSGLGNSRNNECCSNKRCECNNGNSGGNNWIILIIILLFCCGGFGQGQGGTVCACKKKHCREMCRCGSDSGFGGGFGGFGGCGGFGGGNGCWWIIILIFLFACNGRQNRGCSNNIINLDNCDEE